MLVASACCTRRCRWCPVRVNLPKPVLGAPLLRGLKCGLPGTGAHSGPQLARPRKRPWARPSARTGLFAEELGPRKADLGRPLGGPVRGLHALFFCFVLGGGNPYVARQWSCYTGFLV